MKTLFGIGPVVELTSEEGRTVEPREGEGEGVYPYHTTLVSLIANDPPHTITPSTHLSTITTRLANYLTYFKLQIAQRDYYLVSQEHFDRK